ncbi:MAG: HAMP domain-containing protein, partial [Gaiellales bacterium]
MPVFTFNAWSFRSKLVAGFGLTVGIFLLALGVTLIYSASAQSRWRNTLRWDRAVKGAHMQVRGTQEQMAAQALYVATFDPRYKREWEAGVALSNQGAQAVTAIGDPVITSISMSANADDHRHDRTVRGLLFPAVARGDHAAALAALRKADRYVRVPLASTVRISDRVDRLRAADVARAEAAASRAQLLGIVAAIAGTLVAAALAALIIRSSRRPILRLIEVSEAAAQGDLTVSSSHTDATELGRLGAAFNTMIGSLGVLVGQIGEASTTVLAAAEAMSGSSSEAVRAVGE